MTKLTTVTTVLHIAQPTEGGVARVVTDLVRAQTAAGTRTALLCPPAGPLSAAARAAGAHVLDWVAGREPGANLGWEAAYVARAVRAVRPDVVHLHSAKAGLAGRLALRGRVPTVFQPHAWSFEAAEGTARRLAVRWERFGTRWADRVLCVSEAERERGLRAGIAAPWAVIRNGIDLERFAAAGEVERRQARAALAAVHGVPQRAPLVVCVGRLCRQKGQDLLLAAWRRVAERVPGARLVLVGDGPERARLTAAADPRQVLFAGHTEDPLPWYTAADLVVLPSRWEGMALAPLEAMAVGRAVLLSDVGGARESLAPGQAAECLVPAGDVAALGRALTALLTAPDRRRALARAAQAHARTGFDMHATAEAYRELYETVRARPRAGGRRGAGAGAGAAEGARGGAPGATRGLLRAVARGGARRPAGGGCGAEHRDRPTIRRPGTAPVPAATRAAGEVAPAARGGTEPAARTVPGAAGADGAQDGPAAGSAQGGRRAAVGSASPGLVAGRDVAVASGGGAVIGGGSPVPVGTEPELVAGRHPAVQLDGGAVIGDAPPVPVGTERRLMAGRDPAVPSDGRAETGGAPPPASGAEPRPVTGDAVRSGSATVAAGGEPGRVAGPAARTARAGSRPAAEGVSPVSADDDLRPAAGRADRPVPSDDRTVAGGVPPLPAGDEPRQVAGPATTAVPALPTHRGFVSCPLTVGAPQEPGAVRSATTVDGGGHVHG